MSPIKSCIIVKIDHKRRKTVAYITKRPCRKSRQGPCWEVSGHCNAKNVVYGAAVTYTDSQNRKVDFKGKSKRTYTGSTIDLKRRVAEHRTSFNPSTKPHTFTNKNGVVETKSIQQLNAAKRTKSTLAAHVWEVRDSGLSPTVEWSILLRSTVYEPGHNWCGICLGEVTLICFANPEESLNKRTEVCGPRVGSTRQWPLSNRGMVHSTEVQCIPTG